MAIIEGWKVMGEQINSMSRAGKGETARIHQLQIKLHELGLFPGLFLQVKFWHLCLRGQREIQGNTGEVQGKLIRKKKS
jgi:hypothetical protein